MRYYIIALPEPPIGAFVVSECCDEAWAEDAAEWWHRGHVVPEVEAELDPDLEEPLRAWRAGDDTTHESKWALELAAGEVFDAALEAGVPYEELVTAAPPTPEDGPAVLEAYEAGRAASVVRLNMAGVALELEQRVSRGAVRRFARMVGRDAMTLEDGATGPEIC